MYVLKIISAYHLWKNSKNCVICIFEEGTGTACWRLRINPQQQRPRPSQVERNSTDSKDNPWAFVFDSRTGAIWRLQSTVRVLEGMGANQLCRIVVVVSCQNGRDGHRDMGDMSTYGKIIRNFPGSMKPPGSNLCAEIRRYKYLTASQGVKTERYLH